MHTCNWYCQPTQQLHVFPCLLKPFCTPEMALRTIKFHFERQGVVVVRALRTLEADAEAWYAQCTHSYDDTGREVPRATMHHQTTTPWLMVLHCASGQWPAVLGIPTVPGQC